MWPLRSFSAKKEVSTTFLGKVTILGKSRNMRKRAWPKNQGLHGQNQMPFLVFIETLTYNIQQELACSKTFPSNIVDWLDYTDSTIDIV